MIKKLLILLIALLLSGVLPLRDVTIQETKGARYEDQTI